MKIVKVTYQAKAEFVPQNQANIAAVMTALQQQANPGILYHCCLGADGVSFIHTAFFKSEDNQKILNQLPEFKHFQEQLKAQGLVTPPQQELLTFVGASAEIFNA